MRGVLFEGDLSVGAVTFYPQPEYLDNGTSVAR